MRNRWAVIWTEPRSSEPKHKREKNLVFMFITELPADQHRDPRNHHQPIGRALWLWQHDPVGCHA